MSDLGLTVVNLAPILAPIFKSGAFRSCMVHAIPYDWALCAGSLDSD